ncbi:MAG: AhpC/TSA family protein, partial [Muribaculaceae bacterium]|nr:AhpC/TSA family protein [Muribaculaceae bacterium]
MNRFLITSITALFAAVTSIADVVPSFTVSGSFPGIADGAAVKIYNREGGRSRILAETIAKDGTFELKGTIAAPEVCRITIERPGRGDAGFELIVDNSDITVSAESISSVPPSMSVGTAGLAKSRGITIDGGRVQKEYNEFKDFIYPYEYAEREAHYNLQWAPGAKTADETTRRQRGESFAKAIADNTAAKTEFIRNHPAYTISLLQLENLLSTPFSFTGQEIDSLVGHTEACPDKTLVKRVSDAAVKAHKVKRQSQFIDFEVDELQGKKSRLNDFVGKGKYTLIDFWASWCGPCRAAIPHLRELNNKYENRLDIISVSTDSEEADWET